jgi:hypothetical protein
MITTCLPAFFFGARRPRDGGRTLEGLRPNSKTRSICVLPEIPRTRRRDIRLVRRGRFCDPTHEGRLQDSVGDMAR